MNAIVPALAGLISLASTSDAANPTIAGCPALEYMPASIELIMIVDNAVWEAPEGVDRAEAVDALGLAAIDFECWNPETGRFGHRAPGVPIVRIFTGDRLEALECGIDANEMPLDTPAWRKCDRADELASAAIREVWDAAVEAERVAPVFGVESDGTPVRLSPPGAGLWAEWARSQLRPSPVWDSRMDPRVPVKMLG